MTDDDIALLADLDAGLLDPVRAAQVRAAAQADPASVAALDALAATRAELAALPTPDVPGHFLARWDDALAAEYARWTGAPPGERIGRAGTGATAADDDATREPAGDVLGDASGRFHRVGGVGRSADGGGRADRRPGPGRRSTGRASGTGSAGRGQLRPLVAAAVAVIAVVVVGFVTLPPARGARIPVDLAALALSSFGTFEVAEFTDPARRVGCLAAVGAPTADAPLVASRRVHRDDREGVLLVLGTGELGVFRVVVVDPACGPEGGTLTESTVIGR